VNTFSFQGIDSAVVVILCALTSNSGAVHHSRASGKGTFEINSGVCNGFTGSNQAILGESVELGELFFRKEVLLFVIFDFSRYLYLEVFSIK
jgi:hypothetical protein